MDFRAEPMPYRALRVSQVPVLDREEGKDFRPQTLTIVYAAPLLQLQRRSGNGSFYRAGESACFSGATGLLALWGIRRGLRPLAASGGAGERDVGRELGVPGPGDAQQVEELRPLTRSMAHMLERLRAFFCSTASSWAMRRTN